MTRRTARRHQVAAPGFVLAEPLLALAERWEAQGRPYADCSEPATVLVAVAAELRKLVAQPLATGAPAILLTGNLSEGFRALGPFPSVDDALGATTLRTLGEAWAMTLQPPTPPPPSPRETP